MPRIPARSRHITQEPQIIAPSLLGRDLATFRRRLLAFLLDVVLWGVLTGVLFVGLTAWSFHREDPTFFTRLQQADGAGETAAARADKDRLMTDVYGMILQRCPEAFPRDLAGIIRDRDAAALRAHLATVGSTIAFGGGRTRLVENADGSDRLVVGLDLLMGRFAGVLGWGGLFVGWFTLWALVTGGRSPGKALLRIRVVRLDGGRLRLWDCFSRAGGYSASAATLLLGFLEAIWHPNRQAIHDKIAGTVVVRA